MKPLIYLCDDNAASLRAESEIVRRRLPQAQLEAYESSDAFLDACRRTPPQIVLLDIRIDERSGFVLAQQLQQLAPGCRILFLSDYLAYATDAYDVPHLGYILKSEMDWRLPRFLEKATALIEDREQRSLPLQFGGSIIMIPCRDVLMLEHDARVTHIITADKTYRTYEKIEDLLQKAGPDFTQCHKSFVVNCAHIREFGNREIEMDNGQKAAVSRSRHDQALRDFMEYLRREGCMV